MAKKIILKVFRGDASGGEMVTYEVPVFPGMVILDAIHHIQAAEDGSLAVRWNCKAAKCGSCSAEVDGYPRLLCKTRVDDYPSGIIHVTPLRTFPILRDLVTDVSWNYQVAARIRPLTPAPDAPKPFVMRSADVDRIQEFRDCIECFLCQNVCHVLRDHNHKHDFFGPRFLIRLAGLDMHPMDGINRTSQAKNEAGIGLCNITKCCTEVCPAHIHITDNGIIPLKERVVDDFYDPLQWLWRRIGLLSRKKKR